jgi:hypothetical protein
VQIKTALLAVFLLAAANPANAKLKVHFNVDTSDENVKRELEEGLRAKINSTERYGISDGPMDTDLVLAVDCLVLSNEGGYKTGVVCDSGVTYFPYRGAAVSVNIEAAQTMVVGRLDSLEFIVNSLMNHFINGTTEVILADRKTFLRTSVQLLCRDQPTECKMPDHH